jgi:hypothetical protein
LLVGKGNFEDITNESKTINGVGNAYGDGSNINMSPQYSSVLDPDGTNNYMEKINVVNNPYLYPFPYWHPQFRNVIPYQKPLGLS